MENKFSMNRYSHGHISHTDPSVLRLSAVTKRYLYMWCWIFQKSPSALHPT